MSPSRVHVPQSVRSPRACPRFARGRSSQSDGLTQNAIAHALTQRLRRSNVDVAPQQLREIDDKRSTIEKAVIGRHVDEEIDVALRIAITAHNRSEHAHVRRSVLGRNRQDPSSHSFEPSKVRPVGVACKEPIGRPPEGGRERADLMDADSAPPRLNL